MYAQKRANKYCSIKQTYNGYSYHSTLEAHFAFILDRYLRRKKIASWGRQEKIELYAYDKRVCNYYIDFVVTHNDGKKEYVEVKGFPTPLWNLKWKMFCAKISKEEPSAKTTVFKRQDYDSYIKKADMGSGL